jgi:hypothetical protein
MLDIFEVEIIFMPFKTAKGSCILLKSINDEINNLKAPKTEESNSGKNELLQFFLGIILLGVGFLAFAFYYKRILKWI